MTCQLLLSNNSKVMCNNFSLPFPCKLYATQEILSCINRYLKITTVNKLDNQIIKQLLHGVITKHHISVVQIIFLPQPSALSCSPITNNDTLSHNIATTYGAWPVYIIHSVEKTKSSFYTSHLHRTKVSLENYSHYLIV